MSANTHKPGFIDREGISDKLALYGTVVALMADHPEIFSDREHYALQDLLYAAAKEVWPEGDQ